MAASPPTLSPRSTSRSGTSRERRWAEASLDLLGGPVHDRLPAIASCHAHLRIDPEMAEETAEWISTGLQGLKTGFGKRGNANLGYEHDRDVAYVKAMREVLGPKRMLMIDNGIAIKWDVTDAVRRARAMEEYDLAWIEEPLGAWDPEGLRQSPRQDDDTHRIRRARVDARAVRAGAGDGNGRRDRRRSRPRRGHYGFQEGDRTLRVLPPAGERARLVVGDRDGGEPRHLVQFAGLQAVRAQAAAKSDAGRPRHPPVRACRRLDVSADWTRA